MYIGTRGGGGGGKLSRASAGGNVFSENMFTGYLIMFNVINPEGRDFSREMSSHKLSLRPLFRMTVSSSPRDLFPPRPFAPESLSQMGFPPCRECREKLLSGDMTDAADRPVLEVPFKRTHVIRNVTHSRDRALLPIRV